MKTTILSVAAALLLSACHKNNGALADEMPQHTAKPHYIHYTIKKGQHYAEGNSYKPVETSEMRFTVRFDSTAVYKTTDPANQNDINKLYGFSDNDAAHHSFSARFGWCWSRNALRLFAYVYNSGTMASRELCTVAIGEEVGCSIKTAGSEYIFTVNGNIHRMPRASTTARAKGYQLYPYFGGDEAAPHTIRIDIREEG
ncbi:MAG TPA: hypothetical protein VFR58_18170 [Flavisolibacter sp.]|nr:hypothetical protein [Flavisolibacter sp.]